MPRALVHSQRAEGQIMIAEHEVVSGEVRVGGDRLRSRTAGVGRVEDEVVPVNVVYRAAISNSRCFPLAVARTHRRSDISSRVHVHE